MSESADDGGGGALPAGILLTVAYDGRPFSGFAHQPDRRTIAGELLHALRAIDPTIREIRGSSRTDAGVHAFGQRVAFDPSREIPTRGWVLGTARHLPWEIAVRRASIVPRGFTPRFASLGKRYRYLVLRDLVRDPFLEGRVWRVDQMRDDASIARAAAEASLAVGTHDFAAFRSAADPRENTVRTLRSIVVEVDRDDPRLVRIEVQGDAFMHNMVRILVGTFVDVARERLDPGAVTRALASKRRDDAGITAPPDGLYLVSVALSDEGHGAWPSEPGA